MLRPLMGGSRRRLWGQGITSVSFLVLTLAACGHGRIPQVSAPGDAAVTVPAPYDPGEPRYEGVIRSSRYLTMRDGVKIAIDVYLPEKLPEGERLPTILLQTRYWRSIGIRWPLRLFLDRPDELTSEFVRHGYAWVSVDARGSGASYGTRAYPWTADETKDGAEVVDWIIAQPWSNGRVGAMGISYDGTTAEFVVVNKHPAVKAAAPRFSLFDAYPDIAFPGGLHLSWFTKEWGRFNGMLDRNQVPFSPGFLARLVVSGVRRVDADSDGVLLRGAVRDHEDNWDVHVSTLATTFRDDPTQAGATIDVLSPSTYAEDIDESGTVIYSQSGWFDGAYSRSAIERHLTLTNPANKLILGPWSHAGFYTSSPVNPGRTRFDHAAELMKFFDHYLAEQNTGLTDDKPVHYFTMVEERWKAADTWPPPAQRVEYHFDANHALTLELPGVVEAADTYTVDYTHGTGQQSRWDCLVTGGPVAYPDRAKQDEKLLVYDSPPLPGSLEVTGHPIVTLYVSSTAEDGAFFVYLEDVDRDGSVTYVTEGVLRALHRKLGDAKPPYAQVVPYRTFTRTDAMPLVPGEPAKLVFDLLPISYSFQVGHRIRVAIAGADKDHFTLIPPGEPPTITLYRDASRASHIALPVVRSAFSHEISVVPLWADHRGEPRRQE